MTVSEHRQIQQELKQPDPFFEAIAEAREYYEKNKSRVVGIGTATVAALVAVIGLSSWWSSQGERAAADFASAVSNIEFESPSAAETDLRNLAGRSNAGPYKTLAALYRGDIAARAGRNDEAISAYDEFLASPPSEALRQVGLMGKAAALEAAGKDAESGAALDLASAIDGPYRRAALSDRARLAEEAGDKAAATAALQKLLELEGSGPDSADIERRLAALK